MFQEQGTWLVLSEINEDYQENYEKKNYFLHHTVLLLYWLLSY
jgi:hypothetical protein